MATIQKARSENKVEFVGSAWENEVKEGAYKGTKFLSLKLDRGVSLTLTDTDRISLFPNKKREGRQDADYRASVQVAA